MKRFLAAVASAAVLALAYTASFADVNYTQGSGTVIFDFICFTTKHCTAHTPINSAGTEIFTSSTPGQVTGANGTFPATQSGTWNVTNISGTVSLPTGASTAANQSTANTALGAPGDTACATDNGSCSITALVKRTNQNVTTLNTTAGGAVPAGTNYIGQFGLNAATSGGWTPTFFIAANSNNSTNLKASAGIVHAIQVFGVGSAPAYLKLYDKATAPTCGTDTPVKVVMIPAAATAANGAGAIANIIDAQFSTGIGYCVVTGIANNDNTSAAAATFAVNIDWK